MTFICNGGTKISLLPPGQHSCQRLPSTQTEISAQACHQTVKSEELAGSPFWTHPTPFNSIRSPLRTHFMGMQTKVQEVARSVVHTLWLYWSPDYDCAFQVPTASSWVVLKKLPKDRNAQPNPVRLAKGSSRGVRTSSLPLVSGQTTGRHSRISGPPGIVCGREGTGTRSPVGSPAPSSSPYCCSWAAAVGWPGQAGPSPRPRLRLFAHM